MALIPGFGCVVQDCKPHLTNECIRDNAPVEMPAQFTGYLSDALEVRANVTRDED